MNNNTRSRIYQGAMPTPEGSYGESSTQLVNVELYSCRGQMLKRSIHEQGRKPKLHSGIICQLVLNRTEPASSLCIYFGPTSTRGSSTGSKHSVVHFEESDWLLIFLLHKTSFSKPLIRLVDKKNTCIANFGHPSVFCNIVYFIIGFINRSLALGRGCRPILQVSNLHLFYYTRCQV